MKILLLLTTAFPCGKGEEFLSAELERARGFDRILVCPCGAGAGGAPTRAVPRGAEYVPLPAVKSGRAAYLRVGARPCVLGEAFRLLRARRLTAGRLHELLFFMKNADRIFRGLRRLPLPAADEVVIYSYWFYDAAAAGALFARFLRRKGAAVRQISRAHGFDIHPERAKYGYLPMRPFLLRRVGRVYACSQDGALTLRAEFPQDAAKIKTAYLGTRDCGPGRCAREPFHVVSCSYMVPVKRLHLIAQALRQADFPVLWTHLGSGPEEGRVRALAERFPPHVRAEFLGQRRNEEILGYYKKTPVSVFLNVSASEGISVSMMEACSFGFPILATGVGGTGEIVSDGANGFLLPADFTPRMFLDALRRIRAMKEEEYRSLCARSRGIWEEKFDAAKNYDRFYGEIGR